MCLIKGYLKLSFNNYNCSFSKDLILHNRRKPSLGFCLDDNNLYFKTWSNNAVLCCNYCVRWYFWLY